MHYWGKHEILSLPKTGFLSSQKCPAQIVLKSYDWAKEQRNLGYCIICGNHSQIEKDVFEILLRGKQPLILMLARGMKTRWDPSIQKAVDGGRLLIIIPFEDHIKRPTRQTAEERNRLLIEMSDQIICGYVSPGGQLAKLLVGLDYTSL